MKNNPVTFLMFALVSVAFSAVADDADYSGPEWSLAPLPPVLTAAAQITLDTYSNSDSALVEQKSVRVYQADGTGECQDETFTKVLTEKGKRDNREFSMSLMLPYFTVSVPKMEVIKPDGTITPVDVPANSKESIDESQMSENIYDPNMRVFTVNIPQLDVGDIVHVVARQTIHRSIMPAEFDDENIFEGSSYIRHVSYEVFAPTNLPLASIGLRDQVPGTATSTIQTNGATVDYHWEINNVPRMFDEPNMPPYDEVLQRLFVSTVPTWQDISKWYWNLSKPHLDAYTPAMQQTNDLLIAGMTNNLDKVKAIFYYVSRNIQYMGITPETNRPGFEPHDVSITFEKKYGVCRDKAGLLVEMLRLAGFNAYPTLINIGAKRDQQVPQPDFDHAIVCVELTPGQYTLMDPTDEHTRELLPSQDCNRSYLVCKPEGETLLVSPVPPADEHLLLVNTSGTLDANGTLSATSDFSFNGVNDDAYRNAFSQMRPDEVKRFFEERLKEAIPDFKLVSLKLTPENMMDITVPLRAELAYTASGLTANGGDKSIVSLPWLAKDVGVVNRVLIGVVGLQKRKYPLETEVTCGIREEMSLKLTGPFSSPLDIPQFSTVNDDGVACDENISVTNGILSGSREFVLKTVEFYPDQYLRLKQTLKDLDHDMRKNLIMALNSSVPEKMVASNRSPAPAADSDAEILYSHKTLEIKDAHTAVYHVKYSKRILTYNGKITESAVKINYNPACADAKIVSAVVTLPDGSRQEISADEINAMDQAWNPGAKRYTGGKVLVASLPGVEVGSVIEVEYEVTMHDLTYLADFESFQFPQTLDQKTFTLTAPTGLKVHTLIAGAPDIISGHQQAANGAVTYDWQATNVDALPSEEQLPPRWSYDSGVQYYVGDISDYWKSLNSAMLMHAQNDTNAAALARQLTASAKTKLDEARAIRDFIAQNIRDGGPAFTELPLSQLSDADTTLADGYGHAADRAILYYAMLSAAGFRPEFFMASGLPPVQGISSIARSFPLPDDFQAPLVRITVDGEGYYLNDTDQYSQLGTTGFDGKLAVALAQQRMDTIHAAKDCADKTETDYAVTLAADGQAQIQVSKYFYGQDYNSGHKYFAELPPEERNHYFQEAVSRVAQGARAVGDLTTRFDTYPGLEEFTVELDNYGVVDGNYLYFNLPFTLSFLDTAADQRSLPLFIADENESVVRAQINLPAGYHQTEIVPKSENLIAPGGSQVAITRKDSNGQCVIMDDFTTRPAIISAQGYPKLLDIQSALGEKSERTFLLEHE
jgi:transglutaminase-like putative cysteine protease